MEEKKREKMNRKDYWLHKNIIVKITTNKLGEKFYKKKAIVMDVIDNYTGVVKLLDSGTIIKLDQAHLETVLPAIGKSILVLNGAYRGELAVLEQINEKDFSAKISILAVRIYFHSSLCIFFSFDMYFKLIKGPLKGRIINGIQYDDISKYYQEE
jgi:DNA/RNA-binding protein KIN17